MLPFTLMTPSNNLSLPSPHVAVGVYYLSKFYLLMQGCWCTVILQPNIPGSLYSPWKQNGLVLYWI
jgi:hypothetical protein